MKYFVATLLVLTFLGIVGYVSYKRMATEPTAKAYCNDYGCTNFRDGSNWAIRNCQGATTEAGSTYTCSQKGGTGSCGTQSYCCPGPGMLWTTDMSQCSQSQTGSECCSCPTPTPYMIVSQCNGPCMGNGNCTGGNICLYEKGSGWVCRNPACYKNSGCNCSATSQTYTPTPTPVPSQTQYACNGLCITSADCKNDLECVTVGNTRECRNPDCSERDTCLCIQ
jgi:hypothetical protein